MALHRTAGRTAPQGPPDKEVTFYDERLTSVIAHRTMLDSGIGRMARRDKALVDRISATIILQGYMERMQTNL